CSVPRSRAIIWPRALYQGPLPMRSRALTAGMPFLACWLRYACHMTPPWPAAVAICWQYASAPARPPKGDGANYGGLAGADAYCQQMATAAGRGGVMWHAYLSQQAKNGMPAVNARDRIGSGPWYNARGQMIARDLGTLHGDTIDQALMGNALGKQVSFTEKNTVVNGVGDMPNQHDILTGSRPDGTAFPDEMDHTCNNYTSNADTGSVQLGHADKQGGGNSSWNSAHGSAGCSQPKLVQT